MRATRRMIQMMMTFRNWWRARTSRTRSKWGCFTKAMDQNLNECLRDHGEVKRIQNSQNVLHGCTAGWPWNDDQLPGSFSSEKHIRTHNGRKMKHGVVD